MKKLKILSAFFALIMIIMAFTVLTASASSAYQTYTYAIDGLPLYSPDAYTALKYVDSKDMQLYETDAAGSKVFVELQNPSDIVTDESGNVYIADTGNNRIVCLDRGYKMRFSISGFINSQGINDQLIEPRGLYVTKTRIWVCDTGNSRIVEFDLKGNFIKTIEKPESQLFEEQSIFTPIAIAVDAFDRFYIVSSTTKEGIIVMSSNGTFTQFVGTQPVELSAWDRLWRKFQTEDQKEQSETIIAKVYNNITINEQGVIYVTTDDIDEETVSAQIAGKVKDGKYSPVKMLNATGTEIMRRNGFQIPYGEIDIFRSRKSDEIKGVSQITDVAVGPEKTWSIIDSKRQRVFTYDYNGNLLFAFGDKGTMLGNLEGVAGITYQGDNMLILDRAAKNITVFQRSEYGNMLIEALRAENNQEYDNAIALWKGILKRNANFDTAYIGIGQAMYRNGDYEGSLDFYKAAWDVENYSTSYKEIRTKAMSKLFFPIIIGIVAIIIGVAAFLRWAAKVNKRAATAGGKRTYKEELLYAFHLMFHPFDGFWDLKHEKRGSVRAGATIVGFTVLAFYYQAIGSGYITNPFGGYSTIWAQLLAVLVPLFLFVLANWCLTTLFEGEGSFKDIFIAVSYSLLPVPFIVIPTTIATNFALSTELDLINLLLTFAFIWMGMLIVFGMQVTHDFSSGKNILMVLLTVVGMAFIMFFIILFSSLVGKLVSLITNIITEIEFRM